MLIHVSVRLLDAHCRNSAHFVTMFNQVVPCNLFHLKICNDLQQFPVRNFTTPNNGFLLEFEDNAHLMSIMTPVFTINGSLLSSEINFCPSLRSLLRQRRFVNLRSGFFTLCTWCENLNQYVDQIS